MRATLHHVSARDYLAYAGFVHRARTAGVERELAKDPGEADLDALVRDLVRHASEQPRTRPELLALLGQPRLELAERRPWLVWYLLASRAALVHGPSSSAWRRNTSGATFVPARTWLGAEGAAGDEAAEHLVRRYLAAFGPATRADVSQWTGLPLAALEPAFARLPLRQLRDEDGRRLLDLPRAPLPPARTEAPPRFLPMWDSSLLAHADRSRILPEPYRKTVIKKNGDVLRAFLVDGFVAGTWSIEDERVALEPFEPLRPDVRRELETEGTALAVFHASNPKTRPG
jgi:hypothetical protein